MQVAPLLKLCRQQATKLQSASERAESMEALVWLVLSPLKGSQPQSQELETAATKSWSLPQVSLQTPLC